MMCIGFSPGQPCCGGLVLLVSNSGSNTARLYDIDKGTGVVSNVRTITGTLPAQWLPVGLRQDPTSGTVYIWNVVNSGGHTPGSLYSVNPTSGAAALVGAFGIANVSDILGDLAFDPATGTCYCVYENKDGVDQKGRLLTIDTATGAATEVGTSMWSGTTNPDFNGIGFLPSTGAFWSLGTSRATSQPGTIGEYWTFTIDKTTGLATTQSVISPTITGSGVAGMAFDTDDTLYWANTDGSGAQQLITIANIASPTYSATTITGATFASDDYMCGLAFIQ